jgi:hypothetical protein
MDALNLLEMAHTKSQASSVWLVGLCAVLQKKQTGL